MVVKLNKIKESSDKKTGKPKVEKIPANNELQVTNWFDESDAIDFRLVDIDKVEANEYNPNDMETEFFEAIVKQVQEEGMNQPILVRENPA